MRIRKVVSTVGSFNLANNLITIITIICYIIFVNLTIYCLLILLLIVNIDYEFKNTNVNALKICT